MLITLTLDVNFINILCTAITHVGPERAKKTVKSALSFYAFGFHEHNSCTGNVDEIESSFSQTFLPNAQLSQY